jgi:hypothetical protein
MTLTIVYRNPDGSPARAFVCIDDGICKTTDAAGRGVFPNTVYGHHKVTCNGKPVCCEVVCRSPRKLVECTTDGQPPRAQREQAVRRPSKSK